MKNPVAVSEWGPWSARNHVPPGRAQAPRAIFGIWCMRWHTESCLEIFTFQVNGCSHNMCEIFGIPGLDSTRSRGHQVLQRRGQGKHWTPGFAVLGETTNCIGSPCHAPVTLQSKLNVINSVPFWQWQEINSYHITTCILQFLPLLVHNDATRQSSIKPKYFYLFFLNSILRTACAKCYSRQEHYK